MSLKRHEKATPMSAFMDGKKLPAPQLAKNNVRDQLAVVESVSTLGCLAFVSDVDVPKSRFQDRPYSSVCVSEGLQEREPWIDECRGFHPVKGSS